MVIISFLKLSNFYIVMKYWIYKVFYLVIEKKLTLHVFICCCIIPTCLVWCWISFIITIYHLSMFRLWLPPPSSLRSLLTFLPSILDLSEVFRAHFDIWFHCSQPNNVYEHVLVHLLEKTREYTNFIFDIILQLMLKCSKMFWCLINIINTIH